MKTVATTFAACFAFVLQLPAQDENALQSAGFLQVVNLVSQTSPTYLALDNFEFNRGDPIEVGVGSGTLALRPGKFDLRLSNAIAKESDISLPVTIENGKTMVVICFDEVETLDDGTEEVTLHFSQLIESPETETSKLTVVSLLEGINLPLSIMGRPFLAAPKAPIRAEIGDIESVAIQSQGKTIIDFESNRLGHYIAFLFRDPQTGEVNASLIHNERLEYQQPLGDDSEDPDQ